MYVCVCYQLVKDTASKGLVLEEDKEKLLQILEEQQFRLSRFRPCLLLIRPQGCFFATFPSANPIPRGPSGAPLGAPLGASLGGPQGHTGGTMGAPLGAPRASQGPL